MINSLTSNIFHKYSIKNVDQADIKHFWKDKYSFPNTKAFWGDRENIKIQYDLVMKNFGMDSL